MGLVLAGPVADQVIAGIDVTDETQLPGVMNVLHALIDGPVDVLINNAGVFRNETLDNMDTASIREQFEVNTLAPLMLTYHIKELMGEGGKVANITSRMGSIEDNTSGAYYGYRASKAALNAIGKSLAIDLKGQGIAVAQIHPGFVQTRMVNFSGDITPEQAASGIAARIDELNLDNSGRFWHSNGQSLPW